MEPSKLIDRYKAGHRDFTRADLEGANLTGANLTGANLTRANLTGANLNGADLYRANLNGADLTGTDLNGADLRRANLTGANLPLGGRWEEFLDDVVPQLLLGGGKTMSEIEQSECWQCHNWTNCPLAVAFEIGNVDDVPLLLRPWAIWFVQAFDAKLIPPPWEVNACSK